MHILLAYAKLWVCELPHGVEKLVLTMYWNTLQYCRWKYPKQEYKGVLLLQLKTLRSKFDG